MKASMSFEQVFVTIIGLSLLLSIALSAAQIAHAIDKTAESTTKIAITLGQEIINPREYQMDLEQDTIYIYDGERVLSKLPYKDADSLSRLLLKDNE